MTILLGASTHDIQTINEQQMDLDEYVKDTYKTILFLLNKICLLTVNR